MRTIALLCVVVLCTCVWVLPAAAWLQVNETPEDSPAETTAAIDDSLFAAARDHEDYYGLLHYVEHVKGRHLDSAWLHLYSLYTRDGMMRTYRLFESKFGKVFPFPERIESDTRTLKEVGEALTQPVEKWTTSEEIKEQFAKIAEKDITFRLIEALIAVDLRKKNWSAALSTAEQFKACLGNKNRDFNELLRLLAAHDEPVVRAPIRGAVRAAKGEEYVPVVTADGKRLFFCGQYRPDSLKGEDIYVADIVNGECSTPVLVRDLCTDKNDAPLSLSADGNDMLMFKSGKIYSTSRTSAGGWSTPTELPEPVNSSTWDADAMMTSDGRAMIFSSQRPGGQNYVRTDIDIYVSVKNGDAWGTPMNLGPVINTRGTDRSPFLHPDMKTLYFSSDGHGGLGGLDLFKSTRLSDTSWTQWSEPVNLGKEINSPGGDWGYRISTDGQLAYFAAVDSTGSNHIETMTIPASVRPEIVATVSGVLVDRDRRPVEATIRWEDLTTQKKVGESRSNPVDGTYFIILPLGKNYGYYIDKEGYYPVSSNLDLRKGKEAVKMTNDIVMPTFDQMRREALSVPVNNLFFEVDKSELMKESIPELLRVADIIKRNNARVRLAGHTDNTGTAPHNLDLSQRRADAVKAFLTTNGVRTSLIETVGFGDTKPVASNTNEEGKARNRRVEIKFTK
jgi:outer membrane protein OmpA-like peptidoglycan-associated protein